MKILFISMPSIHAIRWIENLKECDHELYWYDVLNRGELKIFPAVTQYYSKSSRKVTYLKGEYFLSKRFPSLYNYLKKFLEVTPNEVLESIINEIKPDCIHSFEMQACSYPILKTMKKHPNIKWMYSCWGNDLYYYEKFKDHNSKINQILNRVDYMHSDCLRDFTIAKHLGFNGSFLGVIPTGGGYDLAQLLTYKQIIKDRKIILIKGYQNVFGRAINVIKAIESIYLDYPYFEFVVFGAHQTTVSYVINNSLPFKVYGRNDLSHDELLQLMGKSLLYIGNNISDGMPNTLLEAIIMGAFPIQSNPGNASSEIIEDGVNGFLIQDAEDVEDIKVKVSNALGDINLIESAYIHNLHLANQKLNYKVNKAKINLLYDTVLKCE